MMNAVGNFTPDEVCTIFGSWENHSCLEDCKGDTAEEMNEIITTCIECLETGDCGYGGL